MTDLATTDSSLPADSPRDATPPPLATPRRVAVICNREFDLPRLHQRHINAARREMRDFFRIDRLIPVVLDAVVGKPAETQQIAIQAAIEQYRKVPDADEALRWVTNDPVGMAFILYVLCMEADPAKVPSRQAIENWMAELTIDDVAKLMATAIGE